MKRILILCSVLLLVMSSCTKENEKTLTLSSESTIVSFSATQENTIKFSATDTWEISTRQEGEEWITLSTASGEKGDHSIVATIAANDEDRAYQREAEIIIKCGESITEISVIQSDNEVYTPSSFTIEKEGGKSYFLIKSSEETPKVTTEALPEWITAESPADKGGIYTVPFTVAANDGTEPREGSLMFCCGANCYMISVNQK